MPRSSQDNPTAAGRYYKKKKVKYLSLFSGIGGFEKGIHAALSNAECVGYSEIDKHAIKVYQKHFPEHINFGDITKIKANRLPNFDLLVGGFPCQSFSIAGKRKGFADPRGQMFNHIARILRAKKPRCVLLENVKGLLNHDGGRTFKKSSPKLGNLGITFSGKCITANTSGFRNTGNASTLSDILEEHPDQKYFLSSRRIRTLLNRINKKRGQAFNSRITEDMPTEKLSA